MGVALISGGKLAENTNSKMDRLIEVTGQLEFRKGVQHQKDQAEEE